MLRRKNKIGQPFFVENKRLIVKIQHITTLQSFGLIRVKWFMRSLVCPSEETLKVLPESLQQIAYPFSKDSTSNPCTKLEPLMIHRTL